MSVPDLAPDDDDDVFRADRVAVECMIFFKCWCLRLIESYKKMIKYIRL